jgi:histidinol-phosphate phosphatase family protein
MSTTLPTTVVIPTIGRPSLHETLASLTAAEGARPAAVIVVDDRPGGPPLLEPLRHGARLLRSRGGGPAAARNRGWRAASTPWVTFLDDDVVVSPDWLDRLDEDLQACPDDVAGSQGRLVVPLPEDRAPTDWERNTAGLVGAPYLTADMSYRRRSLVAVHGFDERFPRAYREDADLALRLLDRGGRIVWGRRQVRHPVRPEDGWVSVRQQRGNADDALMRKRHGSRWRERAASPRGRFRRHLATTLCATGAVAGTLTGRRGLAAAAAAGWAAATAGFAWERVRPGPRDVAEIRRMTVTSAVIPFCAVFWRVLGEWRHRGAGPWEARPGVVLFDRDGTLIENVPYNGDPELVRPAPTALTALRTLHAAGLWTGVVSNQSGVARGLISEDDVHRVNRRVDEMLGPFDTWQVCPHPPEGGCSCRKPHPGMITDACAELGVDPADCVVIGDTRADVEAARAAGAVGVLVPNGATEAVDAEYADRVENDLMGAVEWVLGGSR